MRIIIGCIIIMITIISIITPAGDHSEWRSRSSSGLTARGVSARGSLSLPLGDASYVSSQQVPALLCIRPADALCRFTKATYREWGRARGFRSRGPAGPGRCTTLCSLVTRAQGMGVYRRPLPLYQPKHKPLRMRSADWLSAGFCFSKPLSCHRHDTEQTPTWVVPRG